MFKHNFIANLSLSLKVKKIENQLILEIRRTCEVYTMYTCIYPDTVYFSVRVSSKLSKVNFRLPSPPTANDNYTCIKPS